MFSSLASPEKHLKNCFNFITTWMLTFPQRGIFHTGLVFCRYNLLEKWCLILPWMNQFQVFLCKHVYMYKHVLKNVL